MKLTRIISAAALLLVSLPGAAQKYPGGVIDKTIAVVGNEMITISDLEQEINLNTVAITLGLEKVEYEPEQFPGLVYRLDEPKVVVLLFGSGKMVCTGAKVPEDVTRAVDKIAAELRAASLMV